MLFKRAIRSELFWLAIIALVAFGLRAWRISEPREYIFDEVYYPKYAAEYLTGGAPFDAHPPAGRLLITAGVALFGNHPFGWRVMPLVFGTLLIPLAYLVAWQLFESRRAGLIAALLVALDGMLFVYSRTSLIDSFLVFFILLALACALAGRKRPVLWLASGLAIGISASVKWVGLGIAPVIIVLATITLYEQRKGKKFWKKAIATAVSLLIVPVVIYGLLFILEPGKKPVIWQDIRNWHTHTWRYHVDLKDTRTYNSKWYEWPLMTKPIHFWNRHTGETKRSIIALGNPAVWWGSTLATIASITWLGWLALKRRLKKATHFGLVVATTSYLVLLLPWALVTRGLFIFHYLSSYAFALLLVGYWLDRLLGRHRGRALAIGFLVASVVLFGYFYPILTGQPINQKAHQQRMWVRSWATN